MKKIISMLMVVAMLLTVFAVGIATTSAAETATITIYGLDGTTEVEEFNVGDEFTVYTTLDVSASVISGQVGSVQGTQTYSSNVLALQDEVSGQYGEFVDLVKVFPVTGESTMANGSVAGKITYNATNPSTSSAFKFDSASSLLMVTTYKVTAAGTGEVKNALKNLAAADTDLTRIVFEGQTQEGKSFAGKATFSDPTPAIDHAEVRIHSLDGRVETKSFNVGDTFTAYTVLNASSVNEGLIASVNGTQRYTSSVLELTNAVDSDGFIENLNTVFPVMADSAVANAKNAGVIKYAGSSTTGFAFNSNDSLLIVTTYRVKANGYADITNKMNVLAAADDDLTRIVFNGDTQPGMSYDMPASFESEVPVPTEPAPTEPGPTQPGPTTPAPTEPGPTTPVAEKLKVTIVNPDNTTVVKEFNKNDTFTVYTVLNMNGKAASVEGTQTYTASALQLTDPVTGEYNEISNKTAMFPILGDEVVAAASSGAIKFNASRAAVNGGYAFDSATSKLIVTNYKVLTTGEATIKTTLRTLIKDDAAATKVVYEGATQSGQSYSMPGSFTDPVPTPTEPGPTEPAPTEPAPTTPAPTTPEPTTPAPSDKATVKIYGFDGVAKTATYNVGDEFTVYTTFDGSGLGCHGFASISASQSFTQSVLQSTDEVDELDAVVNTDTMFPILGAAAVAKISDGLNKYNASTSGINKGFVFDNPNAVLVVTNYKVIAAGDAEVRNAFTTLAADNAALTRFVNKGVVADGYTIEGSAYYYDPRINEPTAAPPTEPPVPTEPAPTEPAPTEPTPTEPAGKATVTIYGIDGTSQTATYSVGETFTVYTTFDASEAVSGGKIASINATQTFTSAVLQSADPVDEYQVVTDNNTMFPILKDKTVARITDGVISYNASTPGVNQGFAFDSADALLIVSKYTVKAAGNAEVRNALITVAASDANLTRIVNKGVVADGVEIGGIASFTAPSPEQPTEPAPTEPGPVLTYLLGDADNNGAVESIDVTYMKRYLAFMQTGLDEAILERNADVDGNGVVEILDVTLMQRYLAFMIVDYPIGEEIPIT